MLILSTPPSVTTEHPELEDFVGQEVSVCLPTCRIDGVLEGSVERGRLRVRFNRCHYRFFSVESILYWGMENGVRIIDISTLENTRKKSYLKQSLT